MRQKLACVFSIAFLSQLVMLYQITVSAERVSVHQILSNPSEFDGQEKSMSSTMKSEVRQSSNIKLVS
jgi:hypothetical protein